MLDCDFLHDAATAKPAIRQPTTAGRLNRPASIRSAAGTALPAQRPGAYIHNILRSAPHAYLLPERTGAKGRQSCAAGHERPRRDPQSPLEQLFDVVNDPHEEHDLVSDPTHAGTLEKLRSRCDDYKETLR